MSNASIAGEDRDKNLVMPQGVKDQQAAEVIPAKPLRNGLEVTEDTECGIGFIRGRVLQRLATKNVFVFLYGVLWCILSASWAYRNASITTIEKRYKIPSKTIGYISAGNDITHLCVSLVMSYYAGKGHKPRWIAFGVYTTVATCMLTTLPHFLYGPGNDALSLTKEYGTFSSNMSTTFGGADSDTLKKLCVPNSKGVQCDQSEGHKAAIIIFFIGSLVSGIGGTLFYTIGMAYMDDNVQKEQTPAFFSINMLMALVGPTFGYSLASYCLGMYISPTLTPTIDNKDPRWLGAWWVGWVLIAALLTINGSVLGLFPKILPKAADRKAVEAEKAKVQNLNDVNKKQEVEAPASFSDMIHSFKRVLTNPILLCNNGAGVFYVFGYAPFGVFMAKYIETQYRKSASESSLWTGTVSILFSASGTILAGFVITKYKPTARQMAMWNVFIGYIAVGCMIYYAFLGCPDSTLYGLITPGGKLQTEFTCNAHCECTYVNYSPVCAPDGKTIFISACHAGCSNVTIGDGGEKTYTNCSCVPPATADPVVLSNWTLASPGWDNGGWVKSGLCPADCTTSFTMFMAVMCFLSFCGSTGRITNFLVSIRCVDEKDKPIAITLETFILSVFACMPSLIIYGYLIDATCLVWGKTCSGTGNCWLYNNESLRHRLNLIAAALIFVGTLFDSGVWYQVKHLKIFDDEDPPPSQGKIMQSGKNKKRINSAS